MEVQSGSRRFRAYAKLRLQVLLSIGVLMAQATVADPGTSEDGVEVNTVPKTLFVVVDGIPADVIERVSTPGIDAAPPGVRISEPTLEARSVCRPRVQPCLRLAT